MKQLIFIFCLISTFATAQHRIEIHIKGLQDSTCYLAHAYTNEKLYTFQDTAKADANGIVFANQKTLPQGLYAVTRGKRKLFDVMLVDQAFSIRTDTSDFIKNMSVKGSKEAKLFADFLKKYARKQELLKKADPARKESILASIEKDKQALIEANEGTFTARFLRATSEVPLPPMPKNATRNDTIARSNYYFHHYWDNFDLSDERFIRTPLLEEPLNVYLKNIDYYEPDSIMAMADKVIDKTPPKTALRRYFVIKMSDKFVYPDLLGRDKVYIHLAEKYILNQSESFDSSTVAINRNFVRKMKPLLIGEKLPNMLCTDTLDNFKPLYDVVAPYTLVLIYDPHCPHCQETTRKLTESYESLANKGLKVYFCCGARNKADWLQFIKTYKTEKFINVFDSKHLTDFENTFNVSVYPAMFLLDQNKTIVANKKIEMESISKMIDSKNN